MAGKSKHELKRDAKSSTLTQASNEAIVLKVSLREKRPTIDARPASGITSGADPGHRVGRRQKD